jgi:uncharacterized protein (TIGR03067 family)
MEGGKGRMSPFLPQSALRSLMTIFASGIAALCGCGQRDTVEGERVALQGRWEVVSWQRGEVKAGRDVGEQYEFDGGRFRVTSAVGEIGPWREYTVTGDADPKLMEMPTRIIMPDKTAKDHTAYALFSINGEQLRICYLPPLTSKNRLPKSLSPMPNSELLTLRRIPFSDKDAEAARLKAKEKRMRVNAYFALGPIAADREGGKYDVDFYKCRYEREFLRDYWQKLLDLQNIRNLVLRACPGVGDDEMEYVAKLTSVEVLDLSSTDITDTGVEKLLELKNVRSLDLSFTGVTDASVRKLSEMPGLKELILAGTLVTSRGIGEVKEKRSDLKVTWRRPYTKEQQTAAKELMKIGFLVRDDIDRLVEPNVVTCQVTINGFVKIKQPPIAPSRPEGKPARRTDSYRTAEPSLVAGYLGRLPEPTTVVLNDIAMDDSIFECLSNIHGLVRLSLRSTRVTDAGIAELKNERNLKYLDLSGTKITAAGIPTVASIPFLEVLNLNAIRLTSEDLEPILKLDRLKKLYVDGRQLSKNQEMRLRRKGVDVQVRY